MGLRTGLLMSVAALVTACAAEPSDTASAPITPAEPSPSRGISNEQTLPPAAAEPTPSDTTAEEALSETEPGPMPGVLEDDGVRFSESCDADDLGLSEFPWPPPQPSTDVTIPRGLVTLGMADAEATLTAVADRLEGALIAAGYVEYSYFGVGCDGFALITRLEQIDAQGNPVDGGERFAPPDQAEPPSLTGFIQRLFRAPPGYYRQIVFVGTARAFEETAPPPEEDELRDLVESGAAALPEEMDRAAFTRAHRVIALIYEFEKRDAEEDVMQLTPSRVSGSIHLERAGIYDGFETDG